VPAEAASAADATAVAGAWSVARTAQLVGVSSSTLRSWERRYGLSPTARTAGGHRRYSTADIAGLQHLARLIDTGMPTATAATLVKQGNDRDPLTQAPTSSAARDADGGRDRRHLRFAHAAESLDAAAVARAATAAITAFGVVDAWATLFAPYLRTLGRHWAETGGGVECEHVTVAVLQAVFDRHAWRRRHSLDRPVVVLTATEAEQHTLPLHALAAALADYHIPAVNLGRVPAASVQAAVTSLRPGAVVVWALGEKAADRSLFSALTRTAPLLCAAGPGWTADVPNDTGSVQDLASAVRLIDASLGRR
jgi:MerR family transcriptional regulator, light-induced transcriptional regulator